MMRMRIEDALNNLRLERDEAERAFATWRARFRARARALNLSAAVFLMIIAEW